MYTGQLSFGHANKKTSVRTFVIFFLYRDRYQPVSMTAASDIRREWNENNNCQCQWSRRVCAIVVTIEVIDFYYLNRNNRDVRKRKKKNNPWKIVLDNWMKYPTVVINVHRIWFFLFEKNQIKNFFLSFFFEHVLSLFFFFFLEKFFINKYINRIIKIFKSLYIYKAN